MAQEIVLNRVLHPFLRYGFGFRVLSVDPDVDLVHVHSHPTRIVGNRRVRVVMSAGSSHYVNVRDYEGWDKDKIRRRYALARAVYGPLRIYDELLSPERVARIYTFSKWAREIYLSQGIPASKVDVIYPGFDVPELPPHRARSDDTTRFLFVGRDFARKGGPLTVETFSRLRTARGDVSLTVVTRDVERVPHMPGLTVLPFLDRTTLYREIYPAADVFVMPTEAEGWGFTNAEAMSFALPVISTAINAIPEVVEHDACGILVPPRDGDALLAAMTRFAASRSMREDMGARGRARFIEKFSRDVFRERLREFYAQALRG